MYALLLFLRKGPPLIGTLQPLKAVIHLKPPALVTEVIKTKKEVSMHCDEVSTGQEVKNSKDEEKKPAFDPEVDLDPGLTEEQKRVARQLLREECDAFSRDEDDIGCAPDLMLNIELHDKTPVKSSYHPIPPPLY
jgi:hypothetical protein